MSASQPPERPGQGAVGLSVDFRRLPVAAYVVAGGTLLYLVLALFAWWD